MKKNYLRPCVNWPAETLPALELLIEERKEITRAEFLKRVDRRDLAELEHRLGYRNSSLSMKDDYHVTYFIEPKSKVPFFVHSAIEHVFATEEDIGELMERATAPKDPLLVVVHPGSLFGSAEMNLGRMNARAVREEVFEEIYMHEGPVIVIDGFLSDEIAGLEAEILRDALQDAESNGHLALRVWGDDSGMKPYDRWASHGRLPDGTALVFDGQKEAIGAILSRFPDLLDRRECVVTGAWASDVDDEGCVNSVADVLRKAPGGAAVKISDRAARLEDDADSFEPDEWTD